MIEIRRVMHQKLRKNPQNEYINNKYQCFQIEMFYQLWNCNALRQPCSILTYMYVTYYSDVLVERRRPSKVDEHKVTSSVWYGFCSCISYSKWDSIPTASLLSNYLRVVRDWGNVSAHLCRTQMKILSMTICNLCHHGFGLAKN